MQPLEVARRVGEYIGKHDRMIKLLGIKIVDVKPGYAKVQLKVEEKHMNAAGVCQGGVIFTLADIAFALACNSHGKAALALDVSISFVKAVNVGDEIWAEASQEHAGRHTGSYIIRVYNQKGEKVAIAKGVAFRFEQPFPPAQ